MSFAAKSYQKWKSNMLIVVTVALTISYSKPSYTAVEQVVFQNGTVVQSVGKAIPVRRNCAGNAQGIESATVGTNASLSKR